jgi:hypothetical protein
MKTLVKSAAIVGVAGVLTLGSMTASEARNRAWIAGAAGFAVGAAIGAAAANASYYNAGYYNGGYYNGGYAYEPAYAGSAYAYDSYAYSPTYVAPAVTYAEPAPVYQVQYRDPAYAYTGDPAYRRGYRAYGYAPGYDAYAYAPGYRVYRRGYANPEVRSVPRHYDPGAGYNSNTIAPWQDWKMQGNDY